MKNKKGQLGLGIIAAITIFIIGIVSVNFLMTEVTNARTNLSCASAATISDGTKLLCLVVDVTVIYWMIVVLSIVGGLVISRTNL